jgi:4-amino-4-deoxy-L-arabinose transferase-like glycosyltransferase
VNQPTPAIVTRGAARRLPRWALFLFCAAYVIPGFVGREPWKNADMTALGYMFDLAQGRSAWLQPTLAGIPPEFDALLPYWLGAWAMQLAPAWMPADFAARLPFVGLLVLTLVATWYGVYHLARSRDAQPVAFAFGGEAQPADYARAMADGALLALIATLGLAQLSHETTPSSAQLGFGALAFYGLAALPYRRILPALGLAVGLSGLVLSGAPAMALLFAGVGVIVTAWAHPRDAGVRGTRWHWVAALLLVAMLVAALAQTVDAWRWRLQLPASTREWRSVARLLLWFTWPAWPLALWTVWRWRRQLASRHVLLPLGFVAVALGTALLTPTSDRSLLVGLPALATLAAFALPTFKRSASALIDWFTLLFFSTCALVIWVVWVAMQTGVPAKPAANVAKLAPGFEPSFSAPAFVVAVAATLAWGALVAWRTGRHRDALWKSLVLPAGGAALSWLLVMSLWLPMLDYARSYVPVVQGVARFVDKPGCVHVLGLTRGQLAALRYHARFDLRVGGTPADCPWLVVTQDLQPSVAMAMGGRNWRQVGTVRRPTDPKDNLLVYRRAG